MGNIPEGFEKVGEVAFTSMVTYEFANETNEFFILEVSRGEILYNQDGDDIEYILKENANGDEYAYAYKEAKAMHFLIWEGKEGIFYRLSGTAELEELISVMEAIR